MFIITKFGDTKIIDNNGNAQVVANLLYDSNGVYHDPTNGHVPDGITVNFTSKYGNLNPKSLTMVNGQAESIFTAIIAGTANIKATANNQSVSTFLTINPTNPASKTAKDAKATLNVTTNEIPMQHTGVPIAGFILAIFSIVGGTVISRRKK